MIDEPEIIRMEEQPTAVIRLEVPRSAIHDGLGDAWEAFDAWIAEHGHEAETRMWESYVAGPESGADAKEWRTELVRPLHAPS